MSGQGKLNIRPLPHLDFVLGWPGIPGSSSAKRNASHIAGNVEVRLGSKGVRCKWLRIELRKIETVPGGENWAELIGSGPIDVWSASTSKGSVEKDADGSCWEVLKSQDFPFRINIPEALPPTARLDKLCGIQYEVVTSLCVKTKKGLIRKEDTSSVLQSVHPITLDKHELHSTWPAYNHPDTHAGERDALRAKLRRERYCFAPGDKVRVKVIVMSNRVDPAKLKSVAVTIKETVTFHGVKPKGKSITSNSASARPSMQRVDIVTQKAKSVGKKLYKGDSKDFDLELIIPKQHQLMSISTAKHVEVSYTMRLYVDISKAPIIIDHIPMMITTFPRSLSLVMMKKIGFVEGLSEREMLIDDDDVDDASTMQGVHRMARPIPGRSLSYTGSSSTQGAGSSTYDGSAAGGGGLNRRDTMMTQATGGMAGRGVPGQLFNFNPYELMPSPFGVAEDVPRPAFAGPEVATDQAIDLSEAERSALYHHSNDPRNAQALGVDYAHVSSLEPGLSSYNPSQDHHGDSPGQRASFAGFSSSPAPISRPQTASAIYNTTNSPARTAEAEKERLYQRARQQAEYNQRRADEHRTAIASQQNGGGGGADSFMSHDSLTSSTYQAASEQEKMRLWERARREAETYQRGFSEGASFPADSSTTGSNLPSRNGTPSLARVDERFAFADGSADEDDVDDELANALTRPRQNSAMYWIDSSKDDARQAPAKPPPFATGAKTSYPSYASAEEEKRRLYNQAKAETDAHLHGSTTMTPSVSSGSESLAHFTSPPKAGQTSTMTASSSQAFSEKEQLRRYQAAQDAVRQHQAAGSSSSFAMPPSSSDLSSVMTASTSQALSEKEQLRRYHAAQDAVRQQQMMASDSSSALPSSASANVNRMSGSSGHGVSATAAAPLSEKEQLARYHAAQDEVQRRQQQQAPRGHSPPPPFEASTSSTLPPSSSLPSVSSAISEKDQMRKYWEARDREAQGTGSNVGGSRTGGPTSPTTMASPRAVYAPNFHAVLRASPASTPLPQAPFAGASMQSAQPKQRVVSYQPTSQFSLQQQQQQQQQQHQSNASDGPSRHRPTASLNMPSFSGLSLNHERGTTPNPLDGPWAPKVASSSWAHEDPDEVQAIGGSSSKPEVAAPPPPPLPPKTKSSFMSKVMR